MTPTMIASQPRSQASARRRIRAAYDLGAAHGADDVAEKVRDEQQQAEERAAESGEDCPEDAGAREVAGWSLDGWDGPARSAGVARIVLGHYVRHSVEESYYAGYAAGARVAHLALRSGVEAA